VEVELVAAVVNSQWHSKTTAKLPILAGTLLTAEDKKNKGYSYDSAFAFLGVQVHVVVVIGILGAVMEISIAFDAAHSPSEREILERALDPAVGSLSQAVVAVY
jgi:hypothetical protein